MWRSDKKSRAQKENIRLQTVRDHAHGHAYEAIHEMSETTARCEAAHEYVVSLAHKQTKYAARKTFGRQMLKKKLSPFVSSFGKFGDRLFWFCEPLKRCIRNN